MWLTIRVLVACYIVGSIPFAYLVTKLWTGKDIRFEGNGNVGARNTMQVAGRVPGLVTMLLDVGKGATAYWLAQRLGPTAWDRYLGGFSVVAGHWFPVWLGWRGGVGQAAASGYLAAMWFRSAAVAVPVFLAARLAVPWHDVAYGLAAAVFFGSALLDDASVEGAMFIVLLLVSTAAKQAMDRPRQRTLLAQRVGDGHPEGGAL